MTLVRSTAIVSALIMSLGLGVISLGLPFGSLVPVAFGLPWLIIGAWLAFTARGYVKLDMEAMRPRKAAAAPAPAQRSSGQRDKWDTMRTLIHEWAETGVTNAQASKEIAERSDLPFSSEIWNEAREIAAAMTVNGLRVFRYKTGRGGRILERTEHPADYNQIEKAWLSASNPHVIAALDKYAQPLPPA